MNIAQKMKDLHRALYYAARQCVVSQFQNNKEAVYQVRDGACTRLYGRPYDLLTDDELNEVIQFLNQENKNKPDADKPIYLNPKELGKLWFLMLKAALYYNDFRDAEFNDYKLNVSLSGLELKSYLQFQFENKSPLPNNMIQYICNNYLNERNNEFLVQGGYKDRLPRDPTRFYYIKILEIEGLYLIKKWQQIVENITRNMNVNQSVTGFSINNN